MEKTEALRRKIVNLMIFGLESRQIEMETILYFTHSSTEAIYFLEELSELMHMHGIPCTINYRDMTVETENHKLYAVSAYSSLIGALPGFKYYINRATEKEFNQKIKFKLLTDAKELQTIYELIELFKH